jgi:hypothetical protein
MTRLLVRVGFALVALAAIAVLFLRSVQGTRSAPYEIAEAHLQNWALAIESTTAPTSVLLVSRPPRELASTLFRQLFTRHAESFSGPTVPFVPLLLQEEFTRALAAGITAEGLLALAREAGMEREAPAARCMAYRRDSAPGVTKQVYFVVFEWPAFRRFRDLAAARATAGSGFEAVAASDPNFTQWLPLRVVESDCVAPVQFGGQGE